MTGPAPAAGAARSTDKLDVTVLGKRQGPEEAVYGAPVDAAEGQSYRLGEVASLVKYQAVIDLENTPDHSEDKPGVGGDYVKAFVFGGLDGIVSTFALVAGLGGARMQIGTLIAVSLAKVLADAFSMGFGQFTSATAELEHVLRVKAREEWETENHEDGEVKEMCEIYMQRGCSKEDSLTMMTILVKYRDLFVEHMLVMEHGIMPPDQEDRWAPVKQGFVCFLAFTVFGLVPLIGFFIFAAVQGSAAAAGEKVLILAYCLTAFTLLVMGVLKSKLTGNKRYLRSGLMMVFNGTIAGGVAYLIGEVLTQVF